MRRPHCGTIQLNQRQPVVADVLKGAIAGAMATWVMDRATTWMYERESREAQDRENDARGGQSAYATAAESIATAVGAELSEDQKSRGATAIHWATGIAAGIKYAMFRRYWPRVTTGFGLPYGVAFFLVLDEMMNPLLGLTPGPTAFPWQTHGRGLAGHLAFGAVNDCTLRLLDRAA